MLRKYRFILFVVAGGFAALINIISRIIINKFTSFDVSVISAFFIALTIAFILNRRFVFTATSGNYATQYGKFTLVNLLALAQIYIISVFLERWFFPLVDFTWHSDTVAHAIGVVTPVITSYFLHKSFTFAGAGNGRGP